MPISSVRFWGRHNAKSQQPPRNRETENSGWGSSAGRLSMWPALSLERVTGVLLQQGLEKQIEVAKSTLGAGQGGWGEARRGGFFPSDSTTLFR